MLRILIAPNAFKGTLSVMEACQAFAKGARRAIPTARLDLMPIADGGDGVMDCLLAARGGKAIVVAVTGPLGKKRKAAFALLNDGSACVEMARASGLGLLKPSQRDPLRATSRGTGDLIAAALARGAKTVVVGLGGTASSDGGAGMAQALGARLLDAAGREIGPGAQGLLTLDRVDASALKAKLRGVRVLGVTDVTNPLLGPRGSASVYGPQKGATPSQVRVIERALARYAKILARDLGRDVAHRPGAGAAGGFGAGLLAFLDGRLVPGAAYVLDACGAKRRVRQADAVLTGEGRLDATSFYGKAPIELARLARGKTPVAAVCGALAPSMKARLARAGIGAVVTLADAGATPAQSLRAASRWAAKAASLALRALVLGTLMVGVASAASLAQLDVLYFSRNEPGRLEQCIQGLAGSAEPGARWRLARALVSLGEGAESKKDKLAAFKAAEETGEKAVAEEPDSAEAHFWLGVAHGRRGETQGIMKSLFLVKPIRREMEATLKLDPNHGGAHRVLGEMFWQLPGFAGGDKKKALAELEAAVRVSPTHTSNYLPLAEAYLKFGRKDDARRVLDQLSTVRRPADPVEFPNDLKDAEAFRAKL